MSVNRLFLRTAAVAALTPMNANDRITFAGASVYDSRAEPVKNTEDDNDMPIIVVYTDDDEGSPLNINQPSGTMLRNVILRIELFIGTFVEEIVDGNSGLAFAIPTTDAELEARLDMFESQVRSALLFRGDRTATNIFLKFVKKIGEYKSTAVRDESGTNKMAMRRILISCEIADDCPSAFMTGNPTTQTKIAYDFSTFPGAPWLRDMLEALSRDKSAGPILDVLGNTEMAAVYLPLLERIAFKVDAIEPEADPQRLAALGKTQGPDGRIELSGVVEIDK